MHENFSDDSIWPTTTTTLCPAWRDFIPISEDHMELLDPVMIMTPQSSLHEFTLSFKPQTAHVRLRMTVLYEKMTSSEILMEAWNTSPSENCPPSVQSHPKSTNMYPKQSRRDVPFLRGDEDNKEAQGQPFSDVFMDMLPSFLDSVTPSRTPTTMNPNPDMPIISENTSSTEIRMVRLNTSSREIFPPSIHMYPKSTNLYRCCPSNVPCFKKVVMETKNSRWLLLDDATDMHFKIPEDNASEDQK